jgi:hypothetical protein
MPTLPDIDLSAIPEGQRDAVAALSQEASWTCPGLMPLL